jgi:hypothetical protein
MGLLMYCCLGRYQPWYWLLMCEGRVVVVFHWGDLGEEGFGVVMVGWFCGWGV